MRITRIYHPEGLAINKSVQLSESAARHVGVVLRLKVGDEIILFNGDGFDYKAKIINIQKKVVIINIIEKLTISRESEIKIHLYQAVSRSEKMDWVMQKAVELGVTEITPVITDYCSVKFNPKKLDHWKNIIISACEQSGRNIIPQLNSVKSFYDCDLNNIIIFDPEGTQKLNQLKYFNIMIGPEGGFSEAELKKAKHIAKLGNRILRTETAAITAITAVQTLYGDFN